MSEWILAVATIVSVYLLWQQNRILARQSPPVPERPKMRRYWPLLSMIGMMVVTIGVAGADIYYQHRSPAAVDWSIYPLHEISDYPFSNETVELDGRKFINCTFDNVTFKYKRCGTI